MTYASDQAVLNIQWNAAQEASITEQARRAPHVLMRPTLTIDGSMWCALYGSNIAEGVAGFGETPEKAMAAFDDAWANQLTPKAALTLAESQSGDRSEGDKLCGYTSESRFEVTVWDHDGDIVTHAQRADQSEVDRLQEKYGFDPHYTVQVEPLHPTVMTT